ncbi:MAG: exodeoxyribonuclease VII large subunit [Dialister sp.]|nr:exodeoxyribonuclease VII large subunit [Dialister sp.]
MKVLTVKEASRLIAANFKKEYRYRGFTVRGTVSNLRTHFSGITFFSLIDEDSRIHCFIGRMGHDFLIRHLSDGVDVTVIGDLAYDTNRSYALLLVQNVSGVKESIAAKNKKRLYESLAELGYFEETSKKPLPLLPFHIGIISSSSGAVIHDIMRTGRSRNPAVRYTLFNSSVQGEMAAAIIAAMIQRANEENDAPDLLILARGGGAEEDLSVFDDPLVVEAVHHSELPIISAIGHETDTTLCDYAADVRASTPTQAAEIAIPEQARIREHIRLLLERSYDSIMEQVRQRRERVSNLVRHDISDQARVRLDRQRSIVNGMAIEMYHKSDSRIKSEYATISKMLLRFDLNVLKQMERMDESRKQIL